MDWVLALAEDFLSGVWLEVEPGPGVMALFCRREVWIFSLAPGYAFGAAQFLLLRAARCAVMAGGLMADG